MTYREPGAAAAEASLTWSFFRSAFITPQQYRPKPDQCFSKIAFAPSPRRSRPTRKLTAALRERHARPLPVIETPIAIVAVLLAVLAVLFIAAKHPLTERIFRIVPVLVFAYFVPTALSNAGIIPIESDVYRWVQNWLLPASLVLLTLSVDIGGILRLGPRMLLMFLVATVSIVIGGPLAFLAVGHLLPPELGEQAWKGLAALCGSWIGGGANFIAIGKSVGVEDSMLALMVIVDVAVANVWMATLLLFAGRSRAMDHAIGANRDSLEELRIRVQTFYDRTSHPTTLADMLAIGAIGIGGAVLSHWLAALLPTIDIISNFVWVVIIATTIGMALSFTKARQLDGAGAGAVGSVFLFLLVATIGARAQFSGVFDQWALLVIGALWMTFHAVVMLVTRRIIRVPIFFAAVGSQANVGGAASAPVVAGAFHPSLAPVGVLLAVAGYVLGTYMAIVCAFLLEWVFEFIH